MYRSERKMVRKRIPKETKVRSTLQKEINSLCPFCQNDDVGHFQIHHIDGDPSNNDVENLILLCPTCHSKITKGDITKDEVIQKKKISSTPKPVNQKNPASNIYNINAEVTKSILGNVDTVNLNPTNISKNVIQPTEIHISQEQASKIYRLVHELVDIEEKAGKIRTKDGRRKAFGKYWGMLGKKFKVTSYHLIPKTKYAEVERWLYQQKAINRPKLRRTNRDKWREEYYKSIYTRSKAIGLNKEDILNIAFTRLNLSKPVVSLKELNDKNLKKLYQIIFSKRGT